MSRAKMLELFAWACQFTLKDRTYSSGIVDIYLVELPPHRCRSGLCLKAPTSLGRVLGEVGSYRWRVSTELPS